MDYRKAVFPQFSLQPSLPKGADGQHRKLTIAAGMLPTAMGSGLTSRPVPFISLYLHSKAMPDGFRATFQNDQRVIVPYGELLADPKWGVWEKQLSADSVEGAIEECFFGQRSLELKPSAQFRSWLEYAIVHFNIKLMNSHEDDMEPATLLDTYREHRIEQVVVRKEFRSGAVHWENPLFTLDIPEQFWEGIATKALHIQQAAVDKRRHAASNT
jgi:hypothetical protein